MGDHPKPAREVTVLQPGETARYRMTIYLDSARPALDEKQVRTLIDDEFRKLAATLKYSTVKCSK